MDALVVGHPSRLPPVHWPSGLVFLQPGRLPHYILSFPPCAFPPLLTG